MPSYKGLCFGCDIWVAEGDTIDVAVARGQYHLESLGACGGPVVVSRVPAGRTVVLLSGTAQTQLKSTLMSASHHEPSQRLKALGVR